MNWLRRLFQSESAVDHSETQKQNRALQKMLAEQLRLSAQREERLIACLDRIVQSRFDPPLMPKPMEQPNNSLFPMSSLSDVLSIEDDREFLEKMNAE